MAFWGESLAVFFTFSSADPQESPSQFTPPAVGGGPLLHFVLLFNFTFNISSNPREYQSPEQLKPQPLGSGLREPRQESPKPCLPMAGANE